MRPKVEWTDDCQGKKDYDGPLVSVSTRYWPSGGGFHVFDSAKPELGLRQNQDGSPPSAHASIILECVRGDDDEGITLADKKFKGPTQSNVQQQVETWVQEQLEKIAGLLNALRTNV
jgi:hypothetical protein